MRDVVRRHEEDVRAQDDAKAERDEGAGALAADGDEASVRLSAAVDYTEWPISGRGEEARDHWRQARPSRTSSTRSGRSARFAGWSADAGPAGVVRVIPAIRWEGPRGRGPSRIGSAERVGQQDRLLPAGTPRMPTNRW
ncbi:hypothetical protein GCM10009634_66130 [Saccharothrix xinjiangensis]